MANLSEDIQCAGSDTRPPMLDKADFASWQQRIRLYCRGKENGVNILKSIDEGPFQMGTTRGIVAEGTEGPINLGPERPRVYSDLSQDEKDRYNADIRATNIILQGLPKDIYSLINHYTDAKDIWDNVKMLLEGSELTKEDRESQLYDDFEHFRQNKGETIHDYYVRFAKLINDMRNIKMTMSKIQLNSKFVNNMLPEWGRFVTAVKLNKGLKDSNFDQLYAYLKQHEAHANENKMMLERLTQQTVDPLALMSNVSPQHYHSQSSTNPPTTYHQPHSADTSQSDLGLSPTDNLIENLTNTLALLTQSYKTFLPQTNNQLRTSSNPRNQATIQEGRVVVQNVQGRQNRGQGNNARGAGAVGYGRAQNRVGNANPGQARQLKMQISQLKETRSELDRTLDFRARDFQISQLIEKVNGLQEQNELFRAENAKIMQHTTRNCMIRSDYGAKNSEQITALKNEMESKANYRIRSHVSLQIRVVSSTLSQHLKVKVDTLHEIRRSKVERPLDDLSHLLAVTLSDLGTIRICVVQIVLWYLDSGCSKHMTGDRSRLMNFVKKFIGTVRFGNDHFGAIMGYGDYVVGDSVISRVYYVEGLGHNLFSVGQFCDSDLEVAFRKHSCYVRDTDGVELLKGSRGSNLYTISVEEMMKSSLICLLSKASKHKSWLWHRRLNHLNFGTINDLARKDLVRGLPRLKFEKDHLCSACQLGKSKKHTHKPKTENTNLEVLNTLHMDLCGPMRMQTINGKKYVLVIVDDYSRFTWVKFLRSKDETPTVVIKFLNQIQVGLNKTVKFIRTDNGTEFVNKTLYDYYESVGIFHQKTVPRTPQQNGVVKRQNRTLVEEARIMLIFSKAPMFLWAEAVATACYTQNRSLIHTRHDKPPYELVHNKKPDLTFFQVFGALCYPTNDSDNLGKLQPRADIEIFIGYAPSRKVQSSPGPAPSLLTPGPISSGLVPNPAPAIPYVPPTNKELEMLFQPMFDEYFNPPGIRQDPIPNVVQDPVIPTGPLVSISIDLDAPSGSHISSPLDHHSSLVHHGVAGEQYAEVNPFAAADPKPFVNVFAPDPTSKASSSGEIMMPEPNQST
ncbi:retrovirus-related pol polyprotein from transposon TNT 1-94 [Tanacetum coccineum]